MLRCQSLRLNFGKLRHLWTLDSPSFPGNRGPHWHLDLLMLGHFPENHGFNVPQAVRVGSERVKAAVGHGVL